ncbi:PP-loop family protein [Microsporum canis CBS 113480]|uniref:tRNA(Ile)-lysidine synthetase n=1 Tax=Arthroderma otae (strain ATCC MYA-4605 / CBS 113480) TaxID=554155 RepID=C5FR47_ARTOC|nr:PP-loop family protein [Microsporum canis CBS 113480]EEQ32350.1 PP-loop family protein [Microsporum canis CBS 113480]
MSSGRSFGALASSPIAPLEFYRALTGLWATWERGKHVPLQRIGLAVSGGSDSMALAYLCSRLVSPDFIPGLDLKAYIVDHKFRPESSREAHLVADRIEKLGIQSKVLTIPWPAGETLTKNGFETQARMLRYQALGKACAADSIRALLLGHHQDDNVETALMRVSKGHRKLGLIGFDEIAPIPECHGLYGVSKSGFTASLQDIVESTNMDGTVPYPSSRIIARNINSTSGQMQISTGGVYLLRPFRSFSKPRLVATCQDNKIPFVSDSTNEDRTFTIRNTVRQLLESEDLLPRALQRPSILSLVDKSREHTEKFRLLCDSLLKKVEILNFDTHFGTLVIKMPAMSELPQDQRKAVDKQTSLPDGIRDIYASVMRSLCDIISPYPDRWSPLSHFRNPACKAFLGFDPSGMNGTVFTVGGVLWQSIKQKSGRKSVSKSLPPNLPGNLQVQNQEFSPFSDGQDNIWLLSRQPMHSGKTQPTTEFVLRIPNYRVTRTKKGVILQAEDKRERQGTGKFIYTDWTDWKLWDNRYWIRIRGRSSIQQHGHLQEGTEQGGAVRRSLGRDIAKGDLSRGEGHELHTHSHLALQNSTLADYLAPQTILSKSTTLSKKSASVSPITPSVFQKLLTLLAPGKIRFSAPILTDVVPEKGDGEELENLQEQLLGMPSLPMSFRTKIRVRTPVMNAEGKNVAATLDVPWGIEWEIRYKWIDPNTVRAVSWHSI